MTNYHDFTTKRTSVKKRKALGVGDWWMNKAKCDRCGDVLVSHNRHDFKTCECGGLSVDGGSWYIRRLVKPDTSFTDLSEKFVYQSKDED